MALILRNRREEVGGGEEGEKGNEADTKGRVS